jgi:FtsP/CotA-like multicopper oxidase with cupredoxin domain
MTAARASRVALFFALPVAGLGGCGDSRPLPASDPPVTSSPPVVSATQPDGWDDGIRIAEAADINPDPEIVEVNLRAQVTTRSFVPAAPTPIWTYNGTLPGPIIRAHAGNQVIVHFTNDLPAETTIHWHGLRVPAAMDGMPDWSQPPIVSGGSFDYSFVVPDASTFWYHPHVDAAAQVGYGLYGPFIVDDPQEPQGLGDEVVLVLSDLSVEPDGSLTAADAGGDTATLTGREGNVVLVNGLVRPTLRARPGLRQRWRVVNAARSRYFQIGLPGHSFERIGGDGGLMAAPVTVDNPLLAPAERADLLVVPQGADGSQLVVQALPYDRGFGTASQSVQDLFVINLEGTAVPTQPHPPIARAITPLPTDGATPVAVQLTSRAGPPLQMGINNVPFSADETPFMATVGETQLWTVTNKTGFAHPFHMHGFFFQIVSGTGPLEWKDTVSIPDHGTVKLAVQFDDRPGMWMFHCHILDHAEAGMMSMLMVMEP